MTVRYRQIQIGDLLFKLSLQTLQSQLIPKALINLPLCGKHRAAETTHQLQGKAHIVVRHIISVHIIVHMLLVLVRSNHASDHIESPVPVKIQSAHPEPCRIHDHLKALFQQKVRILRRFIVLPCRKCHIRRDMLFLYAGPVNNGLSRHHVRRSLHRRDLPVIDPGRLPRVHGSLISVLPRLSSGSLKPQIAVADKSPCRLGLCQEIIGQQKHLRVPEGMSFVAFPAERLCADSHPLIFLFYHDIQMVQGKTQGSLVKRLL